MHRRGFLAAALALGAAPARRQRMTLGFSTYGMPGWPAEKALAAIAGIGFDTAELCLLPAFDPPQKLTPERRRAVRRLMADTGLGLPALMENLSPGDDKGSREKLTRAVELARSFVLPPLIETVLGGGTWEKMKSIYRDRLGGWLEIVAGARVVLAIKPHRFGAMSLPEHAAWLIGQLKSPWLRMVFDQSHYDLRGLDAAALARDAARHTAFVAVKDVAMKGGKAEFLLPGETGKVGHALTLRGLAENGYRGDVNCEVSGMVSGKKGYDAEKAARFCFASMAKAMSAAGVR